MLIIIIHRIPHLQHKNMENLWLTKALSTVSDQMMFAIRSIIYTYGPNGHTVSHLSFSFCFFQQTEQSDNFLSSNCKSKRKRRKKSQKIYAHVLIADTHFTRTAIISHETNRKYDVCVCSRAKKD